MTEEFVRRIQIYEKFTLNIHNEVKDQIEGSDMSEEALLLNREL